MLTTFNLIPMVLLLLYPCQCFQRCLNRCRILPSLLDSLVTTFQGCYRHETKYFAGIYLLARHIFLITLALVNTYASASVFGFYFITLTIFVTLLNPYKEKTHNKIDAVVLLHGATVSFIFGLYMHLRPAEPQINIRPLFIAFASPLGLIMLFYGLAMMVQNVIPKKAIFAVQRYWQYITTRAKDPDPDEAFLQQLEQE